MEISPPNLRSQRQTSHVTLGTSQAREELEEREDNTEPNKQPVGRGNTFRMDQQQIAKLLQALVQVLQGADGGTTHQGERTQEDNKASEAFRKLLKTGST